MKLLFVLILFAFENFNQGFESEIQLRADQNKYILNKQISLLIDPERKLKLRDVLEDSIQKMFVPITGEAVNLGYRQDFIWIKFRIKNLTKSRQWMLTLDSPFLDKSILFVPSANGKFIKEKAGLSFPKRNANKESRLIVYQLSLNENETKTYLLRIQSEKAIQFNIELWSSKIFYENEQNDYLFLGMIYGAIVIMAFYNFFLFISVSDRSYLYYSLYVTAFLFYQLISDGIFFQYFSASLPDFNLLLPNLSTSILTFFGILFFREFLKMSKSSGMIYHLTNWFMILSAAISILIVILQISNSILTVPLGILFIIFALLTAWISFKSGNENARFLIIASAVLLAGILIKTLSNFALLEYSLISGYGMQTGIIIQMVILSFALGERINSIKKDEEKKRALIRSQIANDLHDEIGSNLSSIMISSQLIKKNPNLSPLEVNILDEIISVSKNSADDIRDIIWFVNPQHDSGDDLLLKMKSTASKFLFDIKYKFETSAEISSNLDIWTRRNIFLIYKEILNNICKHSQAKDVAIKMTEDSGTLILKVSDDGVGFNLTNNFDGDGLRSIQKRAEQIRAKVEIISEPNKGTEIVLAIPL